MTKRCDCSFLYFSSDSGVSGDLRQVSQQAPEEDRGSDQTDTSQQRGNSCVEWVLENLQCWGKNMCIDAIGTTKQLGRKHEEFVGVLLLLLLLHFPSLCRGPDQH